MSTYSITGNSADGNVSSNNGTYSVARSGGGTLTLNPSGTSLITVGQWESGGTKSCNEGFIEFDLSTFWATNPGAVISAAALTLNANVVGGGASGKSYQARLYDWGATVTTADFLAGASLSGQTLLAHYTSNGTTGNKTWTDDAMASSAQASSGFLRMILFGADQMNNVAPSAGTDEYISWSSADSAGNLPSSLKA